MLGVEPVRPCCGMGTVGVVRRQRRQLEEQGNWGGRGTGSKTLTHAATVNTFSSFTLAASVAGFC